MSRMTLELEDPEAIAEIEDLMERFQLPASIVVERLIVEAGLWVPLEVLAYPRVKVQFSEACGSGKGDTVDRPGGR